MDCDRNKTISEIYGVPSCTEYDTGLIRRWNKAIHKKLRNLNGEDLAMLLRQGHFGEVSVPLSVELLRKHPSEGYLYDGELLAALVSTKLSLDEVMLGDVETMEKEYAKEDKSDILEWRREEISSNLQKLRELISNRKK